MKLRRIEIENFRGFAHPVEIEMDDFTAFIGRNDIGKSSILAALTIFLEGDGIKMEPTDGCLHGNNTQVRITCEFDGLPEKVVLDDQYETSLAEEHLLQENERLRITKIYDCSKASKPSEKIFLNTASHPVDEEDKSLLPLTITDLKKKATACGVDLETGEASVKAKIRRAIIDRSEAFQFKPSDIPIDKNETKTLWEQILKHLPLCALFISDRSSSDQDTEAQSPMTFAVERALAEIEDDLQKIATYVENQVKEVAGRTCAKLGEMNGELARQLIPSLKDPKIKWKNLFKYTLESDGGVPMDKRGSGVRRLVLLNFFRAEAERKASDSGHRPIIYAIEEPETAQHPDHQKMLMKALLEISNNGGQVLISTHAPGLAGEVPIKNLRFIDKNADDRRTVHSADTGEAQAFYNNIAERLGMLPDSLVRIMICVEGINDIRFLRNISHTLHQSDNSLPDLSNDPRFAIVPMNGGNLRDFVDLHIFKDLMKPEFHIYDQDDGGTYQREADTVNSRADGSCAIQTTKRTMENYIHPAAFARKAGFEIEITDDNNPVELCSGRLGTKNETKKFLNGEVAAEMTVEEIDERDGCGEIRGWLTQLAELAL